MTLRILAIGDQFVTIALMEQMLSEALTPLLEHAMDDLTVETIDLDWPSTPFLHNAELSEFGGDLDEIAQAARDTQIIVTHVGGVSQAAIEGADQLRLICCCRGGPVNINVAAACQRGIPVVNTPARNSQAVIEYTVGLLLAVCRGIAPAHNAFVNGIWRSDLYQYTHTGRELAGQTIGLIGFGAVARGLVPFLKLFGMNIMAYDPYVSDDVFVELGVGRAEFSTLLAKADIVSLHLRATPETIGMMGAEQFAQMKRGAYFINTARGSLVDEMALADALKRGHLHGAGLDTFVEEPPPPDWPLRSLPNVTLTPHIGGASQNSAERSLQMVAADIKNLLLGKELKHQV